MGHWQYSFSWCGWELQGILVYNDPLWIYLYFATFCVCYILIFKKLKKKNPKLDISSLSFLLANQSSVASFSCFSDLVTFTELHHPNDLEFFHIWTHLWVYSYYALPILLHSCNNQIDILDHHLHLKKNLKNNLVTSLWPTTACKSINREGSTKTAGHCDQKYNNFQAKFQQMVSIVHMCWKLRAKANISETIHNQLEMYIAVMTNRYFFSYGFFFIIFIHWAFGSPCDILSGMTILQIGKLSQRNGI